MTNQAPTTGTVREAMTSAPTVVSSEATAVDVARMLAAEDVGSLPVVDGGKLVGIVTDRDLVVRVLAKDLDPHKVVVADVCTESPVVAAPDEGLDDALQRMATEQVRRLPVVEGDRLVGILAQADVARTASEVDTGAMVEGISQDA
jgi:CBS domain-containing protein